MHWNLFDILSQIGTWIGFAGLVMVRKKNKWGQVVGLASQPFWFFTTIYNHQWPVFLVSVCYTINWIIGIKEWFGEDKKLRGDV